MMAQGEPPIRHILIVDDNVELVENMMEILEGLEGPQVRCHATSSAAEARAFCQSHDVALALVDVYLPDDNGTKLLTELKGHAEHAQVIVITGDASLETAIAAVDGGAFSYVVKPFDPKQLIEKVSLALRQHALLCERKELRAELEASEARHRDVVENVPAFVLALDERGHIVVWNRYLEQITGYLREEMLGTQGEGLMLGDGDQRLPLKNGKHRWVRWQRAVVAAVPQSQLTYAIGVDVTDEREMLTRTFRSERLAAVGTLAAGLAHEVRNPLNSASLQLQVLERRMSKGMTQVSDLLPVVNLVKDEIHRLEHLVADFLAFARPMQLVLGQHDLNQVVKSVAELIEPEAQQADVRFTVTLTPELGDASLDPERFRQILINLLRNAMEAAGAGGEVELATRRSDTELSVSVTDNGPGFPAGTEIFDAFYTTKAGGTGLGLSIVHSLVSAHGGRITATSEPGATRFSVFLPR